MRRELRCGVSRGECRCRFRWRCWGRERSRQEEEGGGCAGGRGRGGSWSASGKTDSAVSQWSSPVVPEGLATGGARRLSREREGCGVCLGSPAGQCQQDKDSRRTRVVGGRQKAKHQPHRHLVSHHARPRQPMFPAAGIRYAIAGAVLMSRRPLLPHDERSGVSPPATTTSTPPQQQDSLPASMSYQRTGRTQR